MADIPPLLASSVLTHKNMMCLKLNLRPFMNSCCIVWDSIWGTSCFYESKSEEAKRGDMSAIWPILCSRLSITVVSTPPSSKKTPQKSFSLISIKWSENLIIVLWFRWMYFEQTLLYIMFPFSWMLSLLYSVKWESSWILAKLRFK